VSRNVTAYESSAAGDEIFGHVEALTTGLLADNGPLVIIPMIPSLGTSFAVRCA